MEAQASGLGLKRRIGLLGASVILVGTIFAAPAQAGIAQQCAKKNSEDAQERCCKKQAKTNQQKNKCLNFVRNN
jgi:hypothetical protein